MMNYYERHLGDYIKDTAHLSLLEHGVYTRLLDVYYAREAPLPANEVARLIGARSPEEREALAAVLAEFFVLGLEEYRQPRCDAEIARFQDKQRKAKASADARWSKTDRNAEASPTAMRTHSEGNALQTPDTRHQYSDVEHPQGKTPTGAKTVTLKAKDLVAEGVDAKIADDWLTVRKAKKAPLTQSSWEAVKREAATAGLTPAQAVKIAAESNWQGFKASWLQRDSLNGSGRSGDDIFVGVR